MKLPATEETRRRVSVPTTQPLGGEQVQALAAVLSDLRNDLGLSAALGPKQAEKNLVFAQPLDALQAGAVVVGERADADYRVRATLVARQCHVVSRFPCQSVTAVNAFWTPPAAAQVVPLAGTSKARASVAKPPLPTPLQVRLLKVLLATGEGEVGGTDLLDAAPSPATELKVVSGWRWQPETSHDRLKNIFEVERFSGTSVPASEQDFSGVVLLATLESIVSKPAQAQLTAQGQGRGCAPLPTVKRAVSSVAVLEQVVEL